MGGVGGGGGLLFVRCMSFSVFPHTLHLNNSRSVSCAHIHKIPSCLSLIFSFNLCAGENCTPYMHGDVYARWQCTN